MNIEPIQDSIVARLQTFFSSQPTFVAKRVPDTEADFKKAVAGIVTYVAYTGSRSSGVITSSPVMQKRILQWSIEVYGRGLYGSSSSHAARHLLELGLIGFRPQSCNRLYFVKDEVGRGEDLIWYQVYSLECETMMVQDEQADDIVVPHFTELESIFTNAGDATDASNGEATTVIP